MTVPRRTEGDRSRCPLLWQRRQCEGDVRREPPLALPFEDGLNIFGPSDWRGRPALDAVALCELLGEGEGRSSLRLSSKLAVGLDRE